VTAVACIGGGNPRRNDNSACWLAGEAESEGLIHSKVDSRAGHFSLPGRYDGQMPIALVTVRLRLPSRTLKEKRTIVKSVVERLRNRFNASVAELDDLDDPAVATIGAAVVSNEGRHADEQAQSIVAAIEAWRLDAEVLEIGTELIQV
jgi:uncharacterized protein